jgi:tRNA threonylcarbamoyladenosine biosynthesis protein TsaE
LLVRDPVITTSSPEETREVARSLASLLEPGDVVLLAGQLGVGKTEFAKGIAEGLDVEERVVSPTFTLAREYRGRLRLLHVDLYRLDREQEVLDLGLEDLAESPFSGDAAVTVIEWGDVAAGLLPADHLEVVIQLLDELPVEELDESADNVRELSVEPRGPSWAGRAVALAALFDEDAT